ncbi:MAG: hypothetical protein ACRENN_03005 [Candidatus Eiseniibacteriota bacterium]
MRTVLTSMAAVAAAISLVAVSPAEAGKGMKANKKHGPSNDFSVSAAYTGYLSEVLKINNTSYEVAPDAMVYVLGEGPVPAGMMVYDRPIFASGERQGNKSVVHSIIVLPMVADAGNSPTAGEVSPNVPR